MSMPEIVIILIALLVMISIIKLVKGAIKFLLTVIVLLVMVVSLVLFAPSSSASMFVTENIAAQIRMDVKGDYEAGDLIKEIDSSDIDAEEGLLGFVVKQASSAASNIKLETLELKDAIIWFDKDSDGVVISIYKT